MNIPTSIPPKENKRMNPGISNGVKSFLKFLAIFIIILLLSALLTPILFKFLPFKFEKIFNRVMMIGILLAAALFVRFKKEALDRLGLLWKKESAGFLFAGFAAGLLTLACAEVLRLAAGCAIWAPKTFPWVVWAGKFAAAAGVGILIGVIEEFFFRGVVFRSVLDISKNRVVLSILITSAFYSIVHFIGLKKIFIGPDPGFLDGLKLIGAPFLSLAEWPEFWPEAVGLFLFGIALNGVSYKTGSLFPNIGLHAGCVLFLRMDDLFLKFGSAQSVLWGSKLIYDGVVGWLFLILVGVILRGLLPKEAFAASKNISQKAPC